jgi:hypothetical protein
MMSKYLLPPISNGNPIEQALIRRWWHEYYQASGLLVWEYYIGGNYIDAVWFPNSNQLGEVPGRQTNKLYPLHGNEVVLLEAKERFLSHGLIGQALVYKVLVEETGAILREVCILAQYDSRFMMSAAKKLGLSVDVRPL